MDFFSDFFLGTATNLVGVFAGVVLALWTERKREERQSTKQMAEQARDLAHSRRLVLSSVVKNTSEAKRLAGVLETDEDPYLFHATFEMAVWEATQVQFMRLATLDERVHLSRFFNQVNRLTRLIEFHRGLRVQLELRQSTLDAGDRVLLSQSAERLHVVADDVRIDGLVVVSDLGEPMHKRLLGIHESPPESDTAAGVAYLP
ncbi:MAG: hypothetical protein ABL963_14415 [Longimicrobiales bacterium]